jgi:hypothetical protein
VFSAADRESAYVIDGLMHNEVGEQRVLPGRNNKPKKMWRLSKQEQVVEVEALESELEYTRTFLRKYNFV